MVSAGLRKLTMSPRNVKYLLETSMGSDSDSDSDDGDGDGDGEEGKGEGEGDCKDMVGLLVRGLLVDEAQYPDAHSTLAQSWRLEQVRQDCASVLCNMSFDEAHRERLLRHPQRERMVSRLRELAEPTRDGGNGAAAVAAAEPEPEPQVGAVADAAPDGGVSCEDNAARALFWLEDVESKKRFAHSASGQARLVSPPSRRFASSSRCCAPRPLSARRTCCACRGSEQTYGWAKPETVDRGCGLRRAAKRGRGARGRRPATA